MTRVLAVAAGLALAGGLAADDKKDPKGQTVRTVLEVTTKVLESDPPVLEITAVGEVPTGGWTGAKLTPREAKKAPADGVYEFELTAVPPDGVATQVISKVTATHKWKAPPKDLKGIKVYGVGEGAKTVKAGEKGK